MEVLKQIGMGVAGIAGSALATYMLHGGEGPYGAAEKYFASRGGAIEKTYPELASLTKGENAASIKALSAAKSRDEKLNLAAQVFLGFWMINGDARADLCKRSGVDLSLFVEKFERRNQRQHAKALAYLEAAGLKEERLYKSRRSDLMQKLRMQILYLDGSGTAMSTSSACQLMIVEAEKYLGKLNFSILEPNLNQVLLGS
jgi:hypothetical protein